MAIAPVVIEFLAKGMPQVQQAFQSIQASAIKAARAQANEADKAAKAQVNAAKKAEQDIEKLKEQSLKTRTKMIRFEYDETTKANKQSLAGRLAMLRRDYEATVKTAQAKLAAEKKAKEAEVTFTKSSNDRIYREEQARNARIKKLADARISIRRREADREKQIDKEVARSREQAEKSWQSRVEAGRGTSASRRAAIRNIEANKERAEQALKDLDAWQKGGAPAPKPHRNNSALGRFVEAAGGVVVRGVMSGMQRASQVGMGLAGTAAQLGGGFSIADSVTGEKDLQKRAAILSASTTLAGANADRVIGQDEILKRAKAIGISQNIDPAEVLAAFDSTKKLTGDLGMAMNLMPAVAKIATATGSDLSDVSGLAGNLLANRGHYEKKDAAKVQAEIESQLRVLTKQGIVGGVELEDFAKYGARLTAGSVMFGGDKSTNEATLGAMAQMSKQYGGASSPAEAALASQRFSTDVAKHSDKLKDLGINASDGKGNLRDAQSLVLEMLAATKGDVMKLYDTGLGERGIKPLIGAANLYKAAGGGEAGLAAVKKEFSKYTGGVSNEDVDKANKQVLASQGFEQAMLELRIAAGEQLLPAFRDMLPAIRDMIPLLVNAAQVGIPAFTDLMKTIADFAKANKGIIEDIAAHPVGTLIAFELTKSFASAGLPALLRALFSGAFPGAPVPGVTPPGGVPGGVPGAVPGAPPMTAGVGLAAVAVGTAQMYELGKVYTSTRAAQTAGADRALEVSKMDPVKAAAEIEKAKNGPGAIEGYANKVNDTVTAALAGVMPLMLAGKYAGDWAGKAITGTSQSERGDQGIANARMLEALEEIAQNTKATGPANNSGATGAARSIPITSR